MNPCTQTPPLGLPIQGGGSSEKRIERFLPPVGSVAGAARGFVGTALHDWGFPGLIDNAVVVTGELFNSVAVFMVVVLHFTPDREKPAELVRTFRSLTAPGSYLAPRTDPQPHRRGRTVQDRVDSPQPLGNPCCAPALPAWPPFPQRPRTRKGRRRTGWGFSCVARANPR